MVESGHDVEVVIAGDGDERSALAQNAEDAVQHLAHDGNERSSSFLPTV